MKHIGTSMVYKLKMIINFMVLMAIRLLLGKNAYITVSSLNSSPYYDGNIDKIEDAFTANDKGGRMELVGANKDSIEFKELVGSSVIVNKDNQAFSAVGNDWVFPGYGNNTGRYCVTYKQHLWIVKKVMIHSDNNWSQSHWELDQDLGELLVPDKDIHDGQNSSFLWNKGFAFWDGSNGSNGDTQYYGTVVGLIKQGSSHLKLTTYGITHNLKDNSFIWAEIGTELPKTPNLTLHVPTLQPLTKESVTKKIAQYRITLIKLY